ncbi:MAG TPA: glycosyltransferase family 39 protein [Pyrinomonadaceae bacterium]|nr:glycosyltransferase family 39 protein [Pyrinomonadaceae bacterium]
MLAKRLYILLFIAIIAFYFYGLGRLPLLGPDEPRYAQVAREMLLRGDLITPTLGGHTWFEKPALLYWLMIAAFKVFGVNEWAARFGPALCGLLTVAAVLLVGRAVERTTEDAMDFSFWSTLVAASSLGLIVFSRAASFDVVITMTTTWALAFFLFYELNHRKKSTALIGFYICVGLSLLAKGLVGLIIPFGVVGSYYLLRRAWPTRQVWLSLLWGLPLFVTVSAIWYGPIITRHGWPFIDQFFIQHHFARYVSNKYHHPQPIYFYPAIILMLALPWSPFLVAALVNIRTWVWRGGDSLSIVRVFALAWLTMPLVFFSFSNSKLPGYILPSLPAAAFLITDYLHHSKSRWIPGPTSRLVIFGATLIFVAVVLIFAAPRFAQRESVKDLLLLADARGYVNAPVLAQRGDDRSAQFYAHDRVIYNAEGEPVTFDEVTLNQARALGSRVVVLIPAEYANDLKGAPGFEIIGDNGHIAIFGWTP